VSVGILPFLKGAEFGSLSKQIQKKGTVIRNSYNSMEGDNEQLFFITYTSVDFSGLYTP